MFNLGINNFRSFQNQNFNFKRINILIGENSGGKSSLLKFLLSLKQTIDSPNESNLKLKGDFTDLGNYEEMIYNREKSRKLEFYFEAKDEHFKHVIENINFYDRTEKDLALDGYIRFKHLENSTTKLHITLSNKLDVHSNINLKFSNDLLGELQLEHIDMLDDENYKEIYCNLKFKDLLGEEKIIQNCVCYKEGFLSLLDSSLKTKVIEQYDHHTYYNILYLLTFQNYIIQEINKIKFVNPIGSSPKRFYFHEDKKSTYNTIDIEKLINVLGDPSLTPREYQDRITLLNKTINSFGIAEQVDIIKNKEFPVLGLNVKTNDFWSNITDVGYGVSLQLPILFQALLSENYTRKGQILLIEQPEVHLHPSLQAKFIDTLLSIGNKNSYFIETHSEHIIRMLQVIVKNKKFNVTSDDISIYYFKRIKDKFEITQHTICEEGRLSPSFPSGFYDASYSLVKELL
ncbi:DUF3696 domain-containing protein [Sphingobacterium sp. JUb56]|uniref:DUF3696 domain-containing protein n=1 Tax=Sphingobacterium sp. JUb56 TaxID=2587145 RepID=UPI001621D6E7|nr:DUF3696 domain-containing protein [Sphingobacterium sp. JUb56]MBB2950174.1 putative ATPase [Sphingobacterium sp. JUb56]